MKGKRKPSVEEMRQRARQMEADAKIMVERARLNVARARELIEESKAIKSDLRRAARQKQQ